MWTLTNNKDWNQLKAISWVKDMHGVPQSPVHHAEGDVATHTRMVLEALQLLPEYKMLPAQDQEIVWAAALLHDVEKRSTTVINENDGIVSPGHAKKGAATARKMLYRDFETPFEIREQIWGLVRYHGLPLWIFEKQNPEQALVKASLEVNTQLLALLAKADVLGRTCTDQEDLLYRIDLFEAMAIELNCWGQAKQFKNNLSRYQYFRKQDRHADFEAFDDTRAEAIIMCGIAGSGKDFYIAKNHPALQVISLDDMRRKAKVGYGDSKGNGHIIQEAKELAREYLRRQIPFIWNATNITLQMREHLLDLFEPYKPKVTIVYVEVSYKKLVAQNNNRLHGIPGNAIEKMIDKLEVPKPWEAVELVYDIG